MKQFKDPIYGYIDVEHKYIPIINSAEFQRLRNIRQTGYGSLYPSALHNRFVHSLGVFHLGKKAINCLRGNIGDQFGKKFDTTYGWDELKETFILACLLHDVGHSPFSHTGESFYNQSTIFEEEFSTLIKSTELDIDLYNKGYGKPHEAMSAIIGIKLLENEGISFNKEFFARAIMGTEYSKTDTKSQIANCLISILNGSLIDVDKLDYLMRDAYVTGYSSMKIDYERLLSGYTIEKVTTATSGAVYKAVFKKGSLSIIENITYANDLERRWIQSNPTILYDCKLIEQAIIQYNAHMISCYKAAKKHKNVFNKISISKEGYSKSAKVPLRLLCDDDIITYLKNVNDNIIGKHYFSRDMRYKPLWKSEGEYNKKVRQGIAPCKLESILDNMRSSPKDFHLFFLNKEELARLEKEKADVALSKQNRYDAPIYLLNFFKRFSSKHKLDFEFAVVRENAFKSNREKMEQNTIYIKLDESETSTFMEMMYGKEKSINLAKDDMKDTQIFYVYTSKKNMETAKKRGTSVAELLIKYLNEKWED